MMEHIWYVTFEVLKRGTLPRARHPRLTKVFATEMEARAFAKEKFDQGLVVTAGTLNPHRPKKILPSAAIAGWIEGVGAGVTGSVGDIESPASGDQH